MRAEKSKVHTTTVRNSLDTDICTDQAGLDLLEGLELRHWHEDDDGLLAGHLHLLGGGDVELPELGLQVRVDLQVEEGLGDLLLELISILVVGLDDLGAGSESHLEQKGAVENCGLDNEVLGHLGS